MDRGDQGIGHVFARGHGGQGQALGAQGRQVLEAVHGHVDRAVQHRPLDLLGEQAGAADRGQGRDPVAVALGLDLDQLDGQAGMAAPAGGRRPSSACQRARRLPRVPIRTRRRRLSAVQSPGSSGTVQANVRPVAYGLAEGSVRPGRPRRRALRPPSSGARAAAPEVAPVVRMSSTRRTVRPLRPGSPAGLGRPRAWLRPARSAPRGQAVRGPDPPERATDPQAEPPGQAACQGVGLVITPPQPPPPVERDRHDPGVAPAAGRVRPPGLDQQVAQPGGQPGVPLVLEPQAELAAPAPRRAPGPAPRRSPGNGRDTWSSRRGGRRRARRAWRTAGTRVRRRRGRRAARPGRRGRTARAGRAPRHRRAGTSRGRSGRRAAVAPARGRDPPDTSAVWPSVRSSGLRTRPIHRVGGGASGPRCPVAMYGSSRSRSSFRARASSDLMAASANGPSPRRCRRSSCPRTC